MPAPKSYCGLDLPVPRDFDFVDWRKTPADRDIPADMSLQEKNQYDYNVEMDNRRRRREKAAPFSQQQMSVRGPDMNQVAAGMNALGLYS
ncbi:hypothetical protein C8F04DRAFT_1249878 [Mycena alexandri]|uniref:Uncharacterized protein n=1 Tax=Mycena alexandri TaxID=1745969 RepID=A0AAD6TFV6_9AGAR|nr:hypothetical protein C8F04DRAFT_1249878 [Mycena alexandri]